jgi:hypothetical protein
MGFQNGWRGPDIVSDGLVLYLDAGSPNSYRPDFGTTWKDMSGFNNSGSLINGPTYSSANGGSIVLDGINDYISFANQALLTSPNFTATIWFSANSYNTPMIIRSRTFGYGISLKSDATITTFLYTDSGSPTGLDQTSNQIILGSIYNIAITFVNSVFSLYINGILQSFANTTTNTVYYIPGGFAIGRDGDFNGSFLNGKIYSYLYYNRGLSASEVLQNYNAQKSRFGL